MLVAFPRERINGNVLNFLHLKLLFLRQTIVVSIPNHNELIKNFVYVCKNGISAVYANFVSSDVFK